MSRHFAIDSARPSTFDLVRAVQGPVLGDENGEGHLLGAGVVEDWKDSCGHGH